MKRNFTYFLLICIPVLSQQIVPTKEQAHQEFVEILKSEGAEASLRYIENFLLISQDQKTIYYIGWSELLRGEYQTSIAIARYLEKHAQEEDLLAAASYMKGLNYIHDNDANTDPVSSFELSLKIYSILAHQVGIYRSYIGLATAALSKEDMDLASRYLVLAFRIAVTYNLDLSLYYSTAHLIELAKGNYSKALEHLSSELELHQKNNSIYKVHIVKLQIATCLLLSGERDKAREYNSAAVEFFQNTQDSIRIRHSLMNLIFINHCNPKTFADFELENDLSGHLKELFNLLKIKTCEEKE